MKVPKLKWCPYFIRIKIQITLEGCPNFSEKLVKGEEEVLILTKCHPGHKCEYSFQIVLYVNWNGVEAEYCYEIRKQILEYLKQANPHDRAATATNGKKSCSCQGQENCQVYPACDSNCMCGATYSFGCRYRSVALRVMEFQDQGCKIRKIFA